jgi:hypothetical protein
MKTNIPVPVTFNPLKHHFRFLLAEVEVWKGMEWKQVETELSALGENLLDFYTGELTVENICSECLFFFKNANINSTSDFHEWLKPLEYRKITLSDTSIWIIREGLDPERYIHIHPAKQSPFSIRVRAATLKTVAVLRIQSCDIQNIINENLQTVNKTRKQLLNLSPVKSLHPEKGILRLWRLFGENVD